MKLHPSRASDVSLFANLRLAVFDGTKVILLYETCILKHLLVRGLREKEERKRRERGREIQNRE